jgi:hypothetical protein
MWPWLAQVTLVTEMQVHNTATSMVVFSVGQHFLPTMKAYNSYVMGHMKDGRRDPPGTPYDNPGTATLVSIGTPPQ